MISHYAKAVVSLLISLAVIVVQWASGAYANGIVGLEEWLGLALLLLGPAGLVAAVANTNFSPATKALLQQVSSVAVVLVQALLDVYSGGFTNQEWIGIAALLLSSLAVYFVPNANYALRERPAS